jgi:hypothetical protein
VKPPKQAPCSTRTKDTEHPIQDDKVYVGFFDKLFLCLVIRDNIFCRRHVDLESVLFFSFSNHSVI